MLILLLNRHCIPTILYSQLSMSQTLLFSLEFSLSTFPGSVCFVDPFVSNR